jgi:hypothetical protein
MGIVGDRALRAKLFEGKRFAKREVEVFGEPVVWEVAAFKRGASLEGKDGPKFGLRETT